MLNTETSKTKNQGSKATGFQQNNLNDKKRTYKVLKIASERKE
jgi:hypothetical protein